MICYNNLVLSSVEILNMFWILTLTVIVLYVVRLGMARLKYSNVNHFPGPTPLPILGNALLFGTGKVSSFNAMKDLIEKYGDTVRYYLHPFVPTLLISRPQDMEAVLSSSVNINKSELYRLFYIWLGHGLIVAPAKIWRHRRKVLTPAFHFKILEEFVPVFEKCGDILVGQIEKKENEFIDVYPLIKLFALDNICETSMGISVDAQHNPDIQYVHSIDTVLDIFRKRIFSVVKRNDFLFKFSGYNGKLLKHIKLLQDFTRKAISERRRVQAKKSECKEQNDDADFGIKKKNGFLDLLLKLADENAMSDEDIREEVDNFMFAGSDTITITISMALFALAKHPEIQEKIFEEIKREVHGELNLNTLHNMHYLECVIKESMRYYTTVPFVERCLLEEVQINGRTIPVGTTLTLFFHALHRNEKIYPDQSEFQPERFLPENSKQRHPYAFLPFSAGPRNCIGQKYAMLAMKTALIKVLTNFQLEEKPDFEIILGNDGVLKSENGTYLKLKKRIN